MVDTSLSLLSATVADLPRELPGGRGEMRGMVDVKEVLSRLQKTSAHLSVTLNGLQSSFSDAAGAARRLTGRLKMLLKYENEEAKR